jgi:hypothetical protein
LVDSDPSKTPMTKLKAAWEVFGTDEKNQREAVRTAFKDTGGFQDYFVLPELPRMPGFGFVVMLRVEFHAILTRHFHPILTRPLCEPGGSRCG